VDEADLPGAGPVLHGCLALDRKTDVVVPFVPDETREAVWLREAIDQALAMLPCTPGEIARHAEVERAVLPAHLPAIHAPGTADLILRRIARAIRLEGRTLRAGSSFETALRASSG
jgi:hypothetical protein